MSNESKPLIYPCDKCDNNILLHIPGYECFCECSKCGHCQDMPTPEQLEKFNNLP